MDNKYAAMTVNERLFVSGLIGSFDKAVQEKRVEDVISILKNVELSDANINALLKSLGLK